MSWQEKNRTPWGRGRAFNPFCRFSRGNGSLAEYVCSLHTHTRLETRADLNSEGGVKAIQARWRKGLEGGKGSKRKPYQETLCKFRMAGAGRWRPSQKGPGTGEARDLLLDATWAVDGILTL